MQRSVSFQLPLAYEKLGIWASTLCVLIRGGGVSLLFSGIVEPFPSRYNRNVVSHDQYYIDSQRRM
jgi:hypothetical protein